MSGDGKTAQIGEYAEWLYKTAGKKLRLYSADSGGVETVQIYIDLDIVDVVECGEMPNPWEWSQRIVEGMVPVNGKWVIDAKRNAEIGAWAFEGFTGIADILMQDAAMKATQGVHVGGEPAMVFREGDLMVGGNSRSHYGSVQNHIATICRRSFKLPGDIIWTAMARRAADGDITTQTVLGPQIIGKALTSDVPRWFKYTFRLMAVPANTLTKARGEHRLYFEDHSDATTPGAKGLGNSRTSLAAETLPESDRLPLYIAPASIAKAFEMIDIVNIKAKEIVKQRLTKGA